MEELIKILNVRQKDDGRMEMQFEVLPPEEKEDEVETETKTEIDIDSIEEIEHTYIYGLPENIEKVDDRVSKTVEKVNELIKAVKHLNKKIKE